MARGQLPKAYLRIDPNLDMHPEAEGMLFLICAAARQPHRGRFASRAILERILGRKRAERFILPRTTGKRPDLLVQEDGSFYLAGWDEWNEGDLTVGERMKRVRLQSGSYSRNIAVTEPSHERIVDRNSDVSLTQKRKKVAKKEKIGVEASRQQGDSLGADAPGEFTPPKGWNGEAIEDHRTRYGGIPNGPQITNAIRPLTTMYAWVYIRAAWRYYLSQTDARFCSPFRFAETFGQWAGKLGPAPDNPTGTEESPRARAEREAREEREKAGAA